MSKARREWKKKNNNDAFRRTKVSSQVTNPISVFEKKKPARDFYNFGSGQRTESISNRRQARSSEGTLNVHLSNIGACKHQADSLQAKTIRTFSTETQCYDSYESEPHFVSFPPFHFSPSLTMSMAHSLRPVCPRLFHDWNRTQRGLTLRVESMHVSQTPFAKHGCCPESKH